jgi:hypothetical protein
MEGWVHGMGQAPFLEEGGLTVLWRLGGSNP